MKQRDGWLVALGLYIQKRRRSLIRSAGNHASHYLVKDKSLFLSTSSAKGKDDDNNNTCNNRQSVTFSSHFSFILFYSLHDVCRPICIGIYSRPWSDFFSSPGWELWLCVISGMKREPHGGQSRDHLPSPSWWRFKLRALWFVFYMMIYIYAIVALVYIRIQCIYILYILYIYINHEREHWLISWYVACFFLIILFLFYFIFLVVVILYNTAYIDDDSFSLSVAQTQRLPRSRFVAGHKRNWLSRLPTLMTPWLHLWLMAAALFVLILRLSWRLSLFLSSTDGPKRERA